MRKHQSPSSPSATDSTAQDCMTVRDGQERRRFLRRGSAFLLATTAMGVAGTASADCDGNPGQRRCSDNDDGANSDPIGCGRCGRTPEVPASMHRDVDDQLPKVKRILGNPAKGAFPEKGSDGPAT